MPLCKRQALCARRKWKKTFKESHHIVGDCLLGQISIEGKYIKNAYQWINHNVPMNYCILHLVSSLYTTITTSSYCWSCWCALLGNGMEQADGAHFAYSAHCPFADKLTDWIIISLQLLLSGQWRVRDHKTELLHSCVMPMMTIGRFGQHPKTVNDGWPVFTSFKTLSIAVSKVALKITKEITNLAAVDMSKCQCMTCQKHCYPFDFNCSKQRRQKSKLALALIWPNGSIVCEEKKR